MKRYRIQFYYKGEVIESKQSDSPIIVPREGERIAILDYKNPKLALDGQWALVQEVQHIIGTVNGVVKQTIMVYVIPDPKHGVPKNDPSY